VRILDDADEPVPVPLALRTLKFLELAVEFDIRQRSYQAEVPTPSSWPQQSKPAALISGVNATLGSMRMGLYTMSDLVAYVWSFLTPRVADHVGTLLAALHFQLMSAVPPCYQGKPGVPTIEEVRGGAFKVPEAEGFLLSVKGSLIAVEAEPLVVFMAPKKQQIPLDAVVVGDKAPLVVGDTAPLVVGVKVGPVPTPGDATEEPDGSSSSGGDPSGAADTSGDAGTSRATVLSAGSGSGGGGDDDGDGPGNGNDGIHPRARTRTPLQSAASSAGDQLPPDVMEDCLRELEGMELGNIDIKRDNELEDLFRLHLQPPPPASHMVVQPAWKHEDIIQSTSLNALLKFLGKYQRYLADYGQPERLMQRESPFLGTVARDLVRRQDKSLQDRLSELCGTRREDAKVFAALTKVILKNGAEIRKAINAIESPRFQKPARQYVEHNAQLGLKFLEDLSRLATLLNAIVTPSSFLVVANAIVTQTFKHWVLLTPEDSKTVMAKVRKLDNGHKMLQLTFEYLRQKVDAMADAELAINKRLAGLGLPGASYLQPPPMKLSGMQGGRRRPQLPQRFGGFPRSSSGQDSTRHPGPREQQRGRQLSHHGDRRH
jgi:hypothetical protein